MCHCTKRDNVGGTHCRSGHLPVAVRGTSPERDCRGRWCARRTGTPLGTGTGRALGCWLQAETPVAGKTGHNRGPLGGVGREWL